MFFVKSSRLISPTVRVFLGSSASRCILSRFGIQSTKYMYGGQLAGLHKSTVSKALYSYRAVNYCKRLAFLGVVYGEIMLGLYLTVHCFQLECTGEPHLHAGLGKHICVVRAFIFHF